MRAWRFLLGFAACLSAVGADEGADGDNAEEKTKSGGVAKAQGPPPFFLQDPTDSMCLGGEMFQRCSIDTLFFVVGKPGNYQIHKRPSDGSDSDDDGTCISKKSCADKDAAKTLSVQLTKCTHCGAKQWNILGDADQGYVLTEGDGDAKLCISREAGTDRAITAPCGSTDVPYTPLQLQFATSADIEAMGSNAARLIGAASDGDVKSLKALLKDGVDANERDWDQLTALIPAASGGHMDAVKLLIKEGADVNARDKDGITALMEAAIMDHGKIVEYLLNNDAEADGKANSEVTALWLASGEGRTEVVKSLLKKGADAANTRVDGITAVMTAAVGGHAETVKLLLEGGADARAEDGEGLTALHNAAENGTVAVVEALVKAASASEDSDEKYIDTLSSAGFTPVIIAAAHGHVDVVRYLIAAGADQNRSNKDGVTSLMYAAASGRVEVMKALLEDGGMDIDATHSNGGTALIEASTGNSSESVSFLLERGAAVDRKDMDGVTPLMAVASQGNLEGLEAVLSALQKSMSADALKEHINLASFSGGTSVMFSAAGGHPACTKRLIELGADVNEIAQATPEYLEKLADMIEKGTYTEEEPHVDGVTAVHVAAQGGHLEDVQILVEAGADVTVQDDEDRTPLLLAVKGNYGEVASALVEAGADPNTPYVDDEGDSHNLLMDAIIVENTEFATLLIDNGADLYHEDDHKVTTLLQASHRGMTDIVEKLLAKYNSEGDKKKSGWVDSPSDEGITPLIAASSEGHADVVQLLLSSQANPNAQDKDQTASLMAASARGHVEIVELLLGAGADVNGQNVDGHTALMFAYNGKNQVEVLWERYAQFVTEGEAEQLAAIEGEGGDDSAETDDGGTGGIIKGALLNHTKMIDLLVKGGADESIKDKEGHAAKDFDYHPDADAEVLDQEKKAEKKRDGSRNEL
mmetsp:Transcript_5917/g.17020  ORF Transcript_5917/g.17020 Transcript_5917/m.17020 type:complete len:928 (-) Transcript_5917:85-2868(-)|eukprot:CAMPEP_0113558482 /NCGR_PEP_ID=MMETSP0015_2-20120614/18372_1 /TAXON_ID=2838 /ORGANISM="Odontella" /LENGTH=927 /DNA_ID=CAMNT_0000460025 /DNA_START=143 /DNA_END=2926 /DNA_ORIENTATION=- /assembly_acc=CAM_ASM_000160